MRRILQALLPALFLAGVLFLGTAGAAFYKYVDSDGQSHFVDDVGKVPEEYRDQLDTYKEKYDHLPEAERKRRVLEERRRRELRLKRQEQERLAREAARERREKEENSRTVTRVLIRADQVVVPAIVGYRGRETRILLLLDTGAQAMVLDHVAANRLHITNAPQVAVEVVGGNQIPAGLVTLDFVRVGPHVKRNVEALIVSHDGRPTAYNGLLGMSFLRGIPYRLDYERGCIVWGE